LVIKRTLILAAGLCWMVAALGIGAFAVEYLCGGAGLQVLGRLGLSVSGVGVGIGVVHFIGFCVGAFLCFVVGIGLCAYAVVRRDGIRSHDGVLRGT
jgi:hypothetical protein